MASTVLAGRYEIRGRLGRGGMATVYEAHDGLLDRPVAVKLLNTGGQRDERARFAAEARTAAGLTHPHIVGVYDYGIRKGQPFIVLELVRGTTLRTVLDQRHQMRARHVIAVGSQVLAALHVAHTRELVHRDVKPANILLPDGIVPARPDQLPGVKLADFGIAKLMRETATGFTTAGQVVGTPRYFSPEQTRGQRATQRSDLYAIGVVLFEMLAGRPLFDHDDPITVALAHRDESPPPLVRLRPDVDRNLIALVNRALAKDPAARPASAHEMREALLTGTSFSEHAVMATGRRSRTASRSAVRPMPRPSTAARAVTGAAASLRAAASDQLPRLRSLVTNRRARPLLLWLLYSALTIVAGVLTAELLLSTPSDGAPAAPAATPSATTEASPSPSETESECTYFCGRGAD